MNKPLVYRIRPYTQAHEMQLAAAEDVCQVQLDECAEEYERVCAFAAEIVESVIKAGDLNSLLDEAATWLRSYQHAKAAQVREIRERALAKLDEEERAALGL